MAAPFGGHPQFNEYIAWARKQGCTVQFGVNSGTFRTMTKIVSLDGARWVIEAGTEQEDHLLPTTIGRFDRRLGLESPWFSIGDDENEKNA